MIRSRKALRFFRGNQKYDTDIINKIALLLNKSSSKIPKPQINHNNENILKLFVDLTSQLLNHQKYKCFPITTTNKDNAGFKSILFSITNGKKELAYIRTLQLRKIFLLQLQHLNMDLHEAVQSQFISKIQRMITGIKFPQSLEMLPWDVRTFLISQLHIDTEHLSHPLILHPHINRYTSIAAPLGITPIDNENRNTLKLFWNTNSMTMCSQAPLATRCIQFAASSIKAQAVSHILIIPQITAEGALILLQSQPENMDNPRV